MERNMAPAIVFSFSKKQCEAYAIQMSKLDLNSGEWVHVTVMIANNVCSRKKHKNCSHVIIALLS